jgi:hypothetical protein
MRKKTSRGWVVALLVGCLILTQARRSEAALGIDDVVAVIGYVQKAYDTYQKFKKLLGGGGEGPDLSAKLDRIKGDIISELTRQLVLGQNNVWQANAETVFQNFRIISSRAPSDPKNIPDQVLAATLARQTMNAYYQIVANSNDAESSYQLAPTFNALITAYVGLSKMEGELTPAHPATWATYDSMLQVAMQTNYLLVGAQTIGCRRGFNPSRPYYTSGLNYVYFQNPYYHSGVIQQTFPSSQLYRDKIANVNIPVTLWSRSGSRSISATCNPGKNTCNQSSVTWRTQDGLSAAHTQIKPTWDADGVVRICRETMAAILKIGGGTRPASDSSTTLPANGYMTDPWVAESRCPGSSTEPMRSNPFPGAIVPGSSNERKGYPYVP